MRYYFVRTGTAWPAAQVVHCTQLGEGEEGGFHRDCNETWCYMATLTNIFK